MRLSNIFVKNIFITQLLCACIAFALAMPALAKTDVIEKEFDVSPGGMLELNSSKGDISLESWDEKRVHVTVKKKAWSQEALDAFQVEFEENSKGVSIKSSGDGNARVSVNYFIKVPNKFNAVVQTGGGSIRVGDMQGNVKVNTSGGSINIGNIKGVLDVHTSGGSIKVGKVSGEAAVNTSGGSINVEAVGKSISANTSGGSINIGKSDGNVVANTSGGSIRISYSKGDVNAQTSGGSINIEGSDGSVFANTSGGNIKVLSAKGDVKVHTSGGGISIENAEGGIEANTAGGSVTARYINKDTKKNVAIKLQTAGGDISLALPENIQANIDATVQRYHRNQDVSIESEFPLTITEKDNYVNGKGKINGGGGKIELHTNGSDVTITAIK